MEVHRHAKAPKKEKHLKHYLFEFLMLFLAVFCGFMAENWREHSVENKKEKDYMKSLVADLASDTASQRRNIEFCEESIVLADSFFACLKKERTPANIRALYRFIYYTYDLSKFTYNDRTVVQLKSSGNFRLIRKKNIADDIIYYDNSISRNLIPREIELENTWIKQMSLQASIIDFNAWPSAELLFNDETTFLSSLSNPSLLTSDKVAMSELLEMLLRKIWLLAVIKQNLVFLKQEAAALMLAIKKEYHLEVK